MIRLIGRLGRAFLQCFASGYGMRIFHLLLNKVHLHYVNMADIHLILTI